MTQAPPPGPHQQRPPAPAAAVWSLVLGLLSVLCLGAFSGIPAIYLGYRVRALIRSNPAGASGDGMAVAGIVLGYVGTGVMVLAFVFFAAVLVIPGLSSLSPFLSSLF